MTSESSSETSGFTPFSIDPSHPFYIHPSDSLGSQIVAVPFSGSSFTLWRSSMLTSLSAKNKLGILDGRSPPPTRDSPYFPFWERCNDMVKAWIINSVSRDIAVSVICLKTAKEVWEDINVRFGQSNGSKYIQIQREISSTSQGSSDIASYFTKLRTLWDELNCAYVGPTCTCGALSKFIEDQQLFQFLNGLNDSFSTLKSSILMMSPLPSVNKVYSLLLQDENQRENHSSSPSFSGDSIAFSASSSSHNNRGHSQNNRGFSQRVNFESKKPPNTNPLFYKYCKRSGHVMEKCYRLHGFPADFKFTKNKKSASCVQADSDPSFPVPTSSTVIPADGHVHGFTKEQYQHLQTLFHKQSPVISDYPGSEDTSPDAYGFAHFAGPFTEEATGNW